MIRLNMIFAQAQLADNVTERVLIIAIIAGLIALVGLLVLTGFLAIYKQDVNALLAANGAIAVSIVSFFGLLRALVNRNEQNKLAQATSTGPEGGASEALEQDKAA